MMSVTVHADMMTLVAEGDEDMSELEHFLRLLDEAGLLEAVIDDERHTSRSFGVSRSTRALLTCYIHPREAPDFPGYG